MYAPEKHTYFSFLKKKKKKASKQTRKNSNNNNNQLNKKEQKYKLKYQQQKTPEVPHWRRHVKYPTAATINSESV